MLVPRLPPMLLPRLEFIQGKEPQEDPEGVLELDCAKSGEDRPRTGSHQSPPAKEAETIFMSNDA